MHSQSSAQWLISKSESILKEKVLYKVNTVLYAYKEVCGSVLQLFSH